MEGLNKIDDQWISLQIKVFTRWISAHLQAPKEIQIKDVTKDLSNGVVLCYLAQNLTKKTAPRRWINSPKRNVDKVQNCELAVEMFQKDGVKIIGISGKDINDNNKKLILGLIWSLISHYTIRLSILNDTNKINDVAQNSENIPAKKQKSVGKMQINHDTMTQKNERQLLLSWAQERVANYPNISEFTPYELVLCALLDSYVPEKINYYQLDPKKQKANLNLAITVMKEYGIPVYVFPDELKKHNNKVDEKTLLTQLASAKSVLEKIPQEKEIKSRQLPPIPPKESNSSRSSSVKDIESDSSLKTDSGVSSDTDDSPSGSEYQPSESENNKEEEEEKKEKVVKQSTENNIKIESMSSMHETQGIRIKSTSETIGDTSCSDSSLSFDSVEDDSEEYSSENSSSEHLSTNASSQKSEESIKINILDVLAKDYNITSSTIKESLKKRKNNNNDRGLDLTAYTDDKLPWYIPVASKSKFLPEQKKNNVMKQNKTSNIIDELAKDYNISNISKDNNNLNTNYTQLKKIHRPNAINRSSYRKMPPLPPNARSMKH